MIDWEKSAELNNCTVEWLKAKFERFPKSEKLVWWICDGGCGTKDIRMFCESYRLCGSCANLKRFEDPNELKKHSEAILKSYQNDPTLIQQRSEAMIKRFSDPDEIKKLSELGLERYSDPDEHRKTSEAVLKAHRDDPSIGERISKSTLRRYAEMDDPKLEMVWHHYLYDDADLSKYTMPMTRSEHTKMHARMREDGYEVPHINSKTDDNGLWGYH